MSHHRLAGLDSNSAAACCAGKAVYDTFGLADAVAKRRGCSEREVLRAYRCPACRRFHVGHVKKRLRKAPANARKAGRAPRRLEFLEAEGE